MATLAIGLTIPLSILADVIWKHKSYEPLFVIGAVPMFCSFFVIAVLTHLEDWDPLMDLCKYAGRCCRNAVRRRSGSSEPTGSQHEQELLISDNEVGEQSSQDDEQL
jgi:solute carrier family 35 protein F5